MALIILGHPNFEKSVANRTIIEELQNSMLDIELRHIEKLYPDFKIDVEAEQKSILRHKTIVLQYPVYWYNMPGILKHWFDLVFDYQFAYGPKGDKVKGRNFLPSFTVGSSESKYNALGNHHFRIFEFCKNLEQSAYFTQMNYIDPIYFHGTFLTADCTVDQVRNKAKEHANRLIARLTELNEEH